MTSYSHIILLHYFEADVQYMTTPSKSVTKNDVMNFTWADSDPQTCLDHCSTVYGHAYECAFVQITEVMGRYECKFFFRRYLYLEIGLTPANSYTAFLKRTDNSKTTFIYPSVLPFIPIICLSVNISVCLCVCLPIQGRI